jgi:cbb3-type cytochrome oxidase subunit 3
LAEESAKILDDHENEEATVISHGMYRECFTFITDKGIGQKATKANEYYNFFRGLSTTCVYSTIISVMDCVYLSIRFFTNKTFVGLAHALTTLVLTIFFGYAVYAFRIRAKQRGELHVAEVFDSMAGYFAEKSS